MNALYSAQPVPVVCSFDPAIDDEQSNLRQYMDSLDMASLVAKPGERLTVFWVGRLKTSQALRITQSCTSDEERNAAAFRMAVVKVENLVDRNGDAHTAWQPEYLKTPTSKGAHEMRASEVDAFSFYAVQEIGAIALQRGFLAPGLPPIFVRPLSSADALGRRAAYSLLAAAQTNGIPSSAAPSDSTTQP